MSTDFLFLRVECFLLVTDTLTFVFCAFICFSGEKKFSLFFSLFSFTVASMKTELCYKTLTFPRNQRRNPHPAYTHTHSRSHTHTHLHTHTRTHYSSTLSYLHFHKFIQDSLHQSASRHSIMEQDVKFRIFKGFSLVFFVSVSVLSYLLSEDCSDDPSLLWPPC